MKVAICVMSYGRHELTAQVLTYNLSHTGLQYGDFGLFVADMVGISKASNTMLRRAYDLGYQYFIICGNDLLEQEGWLSRRVAFIDSTPNAGMVSVPVDEWRQDNSCEMVIGNFMISREVLEKVGAMDERFDPYGAIDLDYNKRCTAAGYKNYYLGGMTAQHLHGHDGQELYGYLKNDMVMKTWDRHTAPIKEYNIPLIDKQQYYGEDKGNTYS